MFSVNRNPSARNFPAPRSQSLLTALLVAFAFLALFGTPLTRAQEIRKPPKGGVADLSSVGPQTRQGDVTTAEGAVDIHYGNQRLRADHVEYNDQTNEAVARGHVIFDYENQHIEADEAHFNVSTGRGTFTNVRGFVRIERKPNPSVLLTDNPLYFEAKNVEKYNTDLYILSSAWITVCDPEHPRWQFFAQHARIIAQAHGHSPGQQVLGAPPVFLFEPHQPEQCSWKPDVLLDISAVWEKKRAAIESMAGQEHLWEYYTRVALQRGAQAARNSDKKITHGEGYQAVFPHVVERLA